MTISAIREQLHHQIDTMPDEIVQVVADFAMFVAVRRQALPAYMDWTEGQWQDFTLAQFFSEDDEIEYTLEDAYAIDYPTG